MNFKSVINVTNTDDWKLHSPCARIIGKISHVYWHTDYKICDGTTFGLNVTQCLDKDTQ